MRKMRNLAVRYLRHRRKLGYRLRIEGQLLLEFARFADREAPGQPVRLAVALRWATSPSSRSRLYHAKRLELIRGFARYCRALDPRTEIPGTRLLGPAHNRIKPHIYSSNEIELMLARARALGPPKSIRPWTFVAIIGLASCTGMRIGELLRLRVDDLDASNQTIRIARAKFSPERVLPLHPSTIAALRRYLMARSKHLVFTEQLFVGPRGQPLSIRAVHHGFHQLIDGIVPNGSRSRPRMHDFRHTFATSWIARWSRQDVPIAHHLMLLSHYLGHRHFVETFWYVSSDTAALAAVGNKFSRYFNSNVPPPKHETALPFPSLIQRFFTEHLRVERNVSDQTVAAYRDTFRLFLPFLSSSPGPAR